METIDPENNMSTTLVKNVLPIATALWVAGCQQQTAPNPAPDTRIAPPQAAAAPAAKPADRANDFPTLARVEYVLQCMLEHGGQNYDNLYHCACAADTLAGKLSYEDFAQAQTFTYLYSMPGERGGEFRDPPQSGDLRARLKEAKALAQRTCFPTIPDANAKPK